MDLRDFWLVVLGEDSTILINFMLRGNGNGTRGRQKNLKKTERAKTVHFVVSRSRGGCV